MATEWINSVFTFSKTESPCDRAVLVYLAHCTNSRGDISWPSIQTIEKAVKCSRSSVKRSLDHLRKLGEISITYRRNPGKRLEQLSSVYRILLPRIPNETPGPTVDLPPVQGGPTPRSRVDPRTEDPKIEHPNRTRRPRPPRPPSVSVSGEEPQRNTKSANKNFRPAGGGDGGNFDQVKSLIQADPGNLENPYLDSVTLAQAVARDPSLHCRNTFLKYRSILGDSRFRREVVEAADYIRSGSARNAASFLTGRLTKAAAGKGPTP